MATWKPYHKTMQKFWNGNAPDLDAVSGLKMALFTATYVPAQATDELYSALANEVTGTNYTAGGEVLGSTLVDLAAGTITFDFANVTWLQHASGFTNARIAVVYEVSSSKLVCYADFAADKGNVAGPFEVEIDAAGCLTMAEV